ncbi:von Willebrand factor type A domain-containing protein, partial [Blastomonas sp.]|uniref:vWA domain-containing protein n=1 Tax=Blastomonas sp. TaxID=1909299 RepID=UPI003593EE35
PGIVSGSAVTVSGSAIDARRAPQANERYAGEAVASIRSVADAPVSTFSVDVDTGSYANVRRMLNAGQSPPAASVRTEEMVNYFRYDYARPDTRSAPFSITADIAQTPWNPDSRLIRIGLKGYDVASRDRPPANLVFLVDVSGSMASADKLGLVKSTLTLLADQLRADDQVSIVTYSGRVGLLLAPTNNKAFVKQAVDCMFASGATAGGAALDLAYSTARAHYLDNGINRIILATDGDFNVGVSDPEAIKAMVAKQRDSGVTLTTLGFGTGNYREDLMESIADAGNGNYAYIDSAMEAQKVLADELSATLLTIAGDVKIQVEFNPQVVREYRLIGYENRLLAEEDFANDRVDAGDIGAGHQVTALYEVIPAGGNGWLAERRYEANRTPPAADQSANEAAFIKLRYKLPGETRSRLIERALPARMLAQASAPRGDMAFAVAVAAFGQKLRDDKYLGSYSFADMRTLAGNQTDFWRQEFLKLTQLAEARSGD